MDLGVIVSESVESFRKNCIIAFPTFFAILVFVGIVISMRGFPKDTIRETVEVFLGIMLIFYSYGVTLVMAREAIETGSTSLKTAVFVSRRLFVSLSLATFLVGAMVFMGSMLLLLPGMAAAYFMMFVLPSVVVEGAGPIAAMGRSYAVVRNNQKDSLVLFMTAAVTGILFSMVDMLLKAIPALGWIAGAALSGIFMGVLSLVMVKAYVELSGRKADNDVAQA